MLANYDTGIEVTSVQLQDVQPPPDVRGAFDDVIAAAEIESQADGYREAKVAEAKGEAARFEAVLVEYQRSPEVTRTRLYLEAMEEVLPKVQKVVIEKGTGTVLPYLPLTPSAAGVAPKEPAR